ncbi:MAG TPA: hypothetical protein VG323_03565 [Thermoanaerobaculia bacterium]|nr:hypothetical protein [Thermoanaerobaculia bacterium]
MSSKRLSLVLCLVSLMTFPLSTASDGTVKGTLTVNGKKFPLTHIYARKREAWPADKKALSADDLSCGVVDLIVTNAALPEKTIAAILQGDYRGSDKIRGVRMVIDASGRNKWATTFLLESGETHGYGMTDTDGSIDGAGSRYAGRVRCRNQDVTDERMFDVTFETPVRLQYSHLDAENAERIPESRFAEELVKVLPGQWKIVRWASFACATIEGTLVVGERINPHTFRAVFHVTASTGEELEEDATISISGTKVHLVGEQIRGGKNNWKPDTIDLDLFKDLMVGDSAMEYLVLRKKP